MNRFDRITAILIQLQSKKVVKAQDLADRFGISLRTVYRDIRSLEEAGVPLYGEAGIGYSLVDGYHLPPVMFTPEEAMAFITAEKLMERFSDSALQNNFTSALYKVKAVLRGSEKALLEQLENHIEVLDHKTKVPAQNNVLDILLKAIADKKAVQLVYRGFGKQDDSERLVEPIGIFYENDNWYTIGYCHLRDSYRQFRIDRIKQAVLTTQPQEERASMAEYREQAEKIKDLRDYIKVVLKINKEVLIFMNERRHYYGFVSETENGNTVEMTFFTPWAEEGLLRWFLMFADQAEILEPQWLNDKACELLAKIIEKNSFKADKAFQNFPLIKL